MRKIILLFLSLGWIFVNATAEASSGATFITEEKKSHKFLKEDLPQIIQDWGKWSVDGKTPNSNCDFAYDDFERKYCYYIARLEVEVNKTTVHFSQKVKTLTKGYISVPGSAEFFPKQILINGKETNIISRSGNPYVYLESGTWTLEGIISSKQDIRYLVIPTGAAVLQVVKSGVVLPNPTIENGILRFETQAIDETNAADSLSVFVYRKLTDDIPLLMTVRLNLNVTGKGRVENLGKIIPENFSLSAIDSPISVYLQKDGALIAEVKAGYFQIDLSLRQNTESLDFVLDNSPVEQEIWVLENDKSRRVIQAPQTLTSVQTQNIPMPENWKKLPAYEVRQGDRLTLKAINYNNKNQDVLTLVRNIKQMFDGSFYSIEDKINAKFKEDGRLLLTPVLKFYSSEINGLAQAVTYTSVQPEAGIEVRSGLANITNVLRSNSSGDIPVAGYNREFSNVLWNLALAPGYQLLFAAGADTVSNSWITDWDLLDVFIVALLTICFYYLFGAKKAACGLVLFILLHAVFWQFIILSFVLCGLLFLQDKIKSDLAIYKVILFVRYSLFSLLLIVSFTFAVGHLRSAIYPTLSNNLANYIWLIEGGFLSFFYLCFLLAYFIYRIFSKEQQNFWEKLFRTSVILLVAALLIFITILLVGDGSRYSSKNELSKYKKREAAVSAAYDEVFYEQGAARRSNNLSNKDNLQYQSLNVVKNVAQTGVGFPTWSLGGTIQLELKGPVSESDNFKLYLLTPTQNIILAFICVILEIFVLCWLFNFSKFKASLGKNGKEALQRLFMMAFGGLMLLAPVTAVQAEGVIPTNTILEEMGAKLTRESVPSCLPECVSIPTGVVQNVGNDLTLIIDFHSNAQLVAPLPTLRTDGAGLVQLKSILINGEPALNILQETSGVFALLNKGINQVEMHYSLAQNVTNFILLSQVKLNSLENKLVGFTLDENSSDNQTFRINRVEKLTAAEKMEFEKSSELSRMNIETFFVVERNFDIQALWKVVTRVVRTNNLSSAATLEIPLLVGEQVIATTGTLSKDKLKISFAPTEEVKVFESLLPVEQDISLFSPVVIENYKEEWSFNVDYAWSFKYSGLNPINSADNKLRFKPNAGEALEFKIFRPTNIEGYVITFDKVDYNVSYGRGVVTGDLRFELRSADAGTHEIRIPSLAEIKDLRVNGQPYPVTLVEDKLTIPVVQGTNQVAFKVEMKSQMKTVMEFPQFDLGAPAVNITQNASMPFSRWVLFVSGPLKGPVVLFWSMLPAWLIVAFVLSRFKAIPVSFSQWFILLLGLTQSSVSLVMVIILWFVVLGVRDKFFTQPKFNKLFQIGIPLLTLLFIGSLFEGIYNGLLGTWNMEIIGNVYKYSSYLQLQWYQDAVLGNLPSIKIISFPVWVYRMLMVVWSMWLAIYFVKWINWGSKIYFK
ncbi:MAG: TMEM181/wntless family protein [Deltaproteobacteria bacterium]|jgi:hypothetical protein|nr:TMEM181/wntless family protein [Deltaproteobacteria bacterium]